MSKINFELPVVRPFKVALTKGRGVSKGSNLFTVLVNVGQN